MLSFFTRSYRRLRFGEPVIVVSGLPRSGTSMAMRMLEAGGMTILSDGIRTADESNPKGYFELEKVKGLDKGTDTSWLNDAKGKAVKIISFLLPHLPKNLNYKIIFMHRDLEEVLASQAKMLEHRREPNETDDADMRGAYEQHLRKAKFLIAHQPGFAALEIAYREVVSDPREQARRINVFLGGRLDLERMVSVVDEGLYRNRR